MHNYQCLMHVTVGFDGRHDLVNAQMNDKASFLLRVHLFSQKMLGPIPDVLLGVCERRTSLLPALVEFLWIEDVPKLHVTIIPNTAVHPMLTNDPSQLSSSTSSCRYTKCLSQNLSPICTTLRFHVPNPSLTLTPQKLDSILNRLSYLSCFMWKNMSNKT